MRPDEMNLSNSEDSAAMMPCPFCGMNATDVCSDLSSSWVLCFSCGSRGRPHNNPVLAIEAWNVRINTDPVFDILPRLWATGHKTKEQDGEWWLFRKDGEGLVSGSTFRKLCVSIALAGF
jgi:hypothetical protein